MKISASLYSSNDRQLEELVLYLDRCQIDFFHLDCLDDYEVFADIARIKSISKTPIDLHIISERPDRYIDDIIKHEVEYVTFQYENLKEEFTIPDRVNTKFGLALTSGTPIEVFQDYQEICDFVLIMTTTPGISGGQFGSESFGKIRKFRNAFPGKSIHVDGGVNDEIGFILRMLGVQTIVSGSYLVNHQSISEAMLHLKSSVIHSNYLVKDFKIDLEDAPVLPHDAEVKTIFKHIEKYKLGFTLLQNPDGSLAGISSNADMRRGLLKHLENFNALQSKDIINANPVTIREDANISELLKLIGSKDFLLSYVPVVNGDNHLTGAISFIHLIRSES
ncbi:MAG: CBS domain-containing protein [Cyclobacteriaceae bacterium]|nr:CBS domain-containing protein [Cyclobacteriaceae bacterium HetDA_MAG_MS6]